MSDKMNTRVQAKLNDQVTEVKALIKHPMETGHTKNSETGELIPAHFIEEITFEHNEEVVMSAQWGIGVSADPFLSFQFEGGQVGDKVTLTWKDNQGQSGTAETEIVAE